MLPGTFVEQARKNKNMVESVPKFLSEIKGIDFVSNMQVNGWK